MNCTEKFWIETTFLSVEIGSEGGLIIDHDLNRILEMVFPVMDCYSRPKRLRSHLIGSGLVLVNCSKRISG